MIERVHVHQSIYEGQSYAVSNPTDTYAAHAQAPVTGDPLATLLGHVLAEALIQNSSSSQSVHADPLLDFTQKFDFSTPYFSEMKKALAASDWLRSEEISLEDSPKDRSEREQVLQNAKSDSALFSDARYKFSSDYNHVYVVTSIELLNKKSAGNALHRANYVFCSAAAGGPDEPIESYLDYWSANDGAHFREALHEGIFESMNMLKEGLLLRAHLFEHIGNEKTPMAALLSECGINKEVEGGIVAESRYRQLIRSSTGDFYSVPRSGADRRQIESLRTKSFGAKAIPVRHDL